LGILYSWATPERLLDEMSLEQIVLFHRHGWKARETEYKLMWGVLGGIMAGDESIKKHIPEGVHGLKKFKEAHPEGQVQNGAWKVSQ